MTHTESGGNDYEVKKTEMSDWVNLFLYIYYHMESLNEQIYRMKSMMGILGESFDWDFANEIVTQKHPEEIYHLLLKM